jgi:hypothetical protein
MKPNRFQRRVAEALKRIGLTLQNFLQRMALAAEIPCTQLEPLPLGLRERIRP